VILICRNQAFHCGLSLQLHGFSTQSFSETMIAVGPLYASQITRAQTYRIPFSPLVVNCEVDTFNVAPRAAVNTAADVPFSIYADVYIHSNAGWVRQDPQCGIDEDVAGAQIEALESDARNAEGRKAAAVRWLKKCTAYQGYKEQLADAQRIQRDAQAHADDCERRLRSAEKTLAALVALAEMVCHAEARRAAQVHLEEKRLYLKGALEYRAAAEALLAARQGAARG